MKNFFSLFIILLLFFFFHTPGFAAWDFSNHSIPIEDIQSGGPPRDGIPALFSPKYVAAKEASFMNEEDMILGLNIKGTQKAYPLRILSWHELVNDRVGDINILVSW